MDLTFFIASMLVGLIGPVAAVSYLRPILVKVLRGFCDGDGGAEFWVRCAYLLAVCGTLLLVLTFGLFDPATPPIEMMRRTFWLVFAGMFVTIAFVASNVWSQVRRLPQGPPRQLAEAAGAV
jgi:hypothetical protein